MPLWLQLFLLASLATAAYAGLSSAPFVPTRKKELRALLDAIPRAPDATIFDLGSGTGTLLFALADRGHRGQLVGYEISLLPFLFSLGRKWVHPQRYRNVSLRYRSFWGADLSSTDVVLCFLLPSAYARLTPWLQSHMKTGSLAVVQAWPLPDWPHQTIQAEQTLPWFLHKVQ